MPTHSGTGWPQFSAAEPIGELTDQEQDIRTDILAGLITDKGGEQQIGTAERVLPKLSARCSPTGHIQPGHRRRH